MRSFLLLLLLLLPTGPLWADDAEADAPAAGQEARESGPQAPDPFARARRPDGTLDWRSLTEAVPAGEKRLKSFSLEYFIKELAGVMATGDRERVQEFFTGVTATDFYKNYGLFLVGGTAAEVGYNVAYRRFLHRHLKLHFVNGVLRSNVALASGLALAQIVNGNFKGKVFAISMGSLALSSATVNAAMSRLPIVRKLHTASLTGKATRMLRMGGFVYQTAELALIFFVGRTLENAYYAWSDAREARAALAEAAKVCLARLKAAKSASEAEAALATYSRAWGDYRNFLYRPLLKERAKLLKALDEIGEKAKVHSDVSQAYRARIERFKSLPLGRAAKAQESKSKLDLEARLDKLTASYASSWQREFDAIYKKNRRQGAFLSSLEPNPRSRRQRPRLARFVSAHAGVSRNRPQTYEDQKEALTFLRGQLPKRFQAALGAAHANAEAVRLADQRLYQSDLGLLDLGARASGKDTPSSKPAKPAKPAEAHQGAAGALDKVD